MPEVPTNPLRPLHEQAQAEFQPYGELEIVSTFGEPQAEYSAVRKAAGLFDAFHRGVLELTGKDRLSFLNNLISNQVYDKQAKKPLEAGKGVYAFLLNAKSGRIEADMNVVERGDRTLLEMDRRLVIGVMKSLDRYRFSENVVFTDRSATIHELSVHGPGAAKLLEELTGSSIELKSLESTAVSILGSEVVVWRDDPCGVLGYHLVCPVEGVAAIWNGLLERFGQSAELGKRPLRPFGWAVFNTTRIEAGRPLFGIDFDDTVLPAETGQLARAISFTKGCYPGQEIVARMHARQQLARQLVGLRVSGDALPLAGSPVYDDWQNQVGGVTSSTVSPILSNAALALAIVKKGFVQPGAVVNVPAEGAMQRAAVATLPFVAAQAQE